MKLLSEIQNLIIEHGSSSILRERLLLIKDKLTQVEEERTQMEKELAACHEEIAQLRAQIKSMTVEKQFVEHRGVLFKRKSTGVYDECPFCPHCKYPMGALNKFMNFTCDRCNIMTNFKGAELSVVMSELPD
jgi:DNA repair exonuclease SbcCD ATPase subunit